MIRLTQTILDPGNCLQTCVACILDLAIDDVPAQVAMNSLAYLLELRHFLRARDLRVVMTGPQIDWRTYTMALPEYVAFGPMAGPMGGVADEHCCVGRSGEIIWDPYPTRPKLQKVESMWMFLP